MLSLEDVTVTYGKTRGLEGLSMRIQQGEVVALVGANGAGKTTTLSAISGVVKTAAGSISYHGQSLRGKRPEEIVRLGVAHVPQGRRIFETLTVYENLLVGTSVQPKSAGSEITRVTERFPVLGRYLHSSAAKLSGGEQQQLAIARGLLSKPELLMLDEPSLGLAPRMIDEVFNVLAELRDEGVTILLVEQFAERAVAFADRAYVLRVGRLAAEGTADEIGSREGLAVAYLGGVA